jgi:tetratricopeptide (TPR) repeat protein
MQFSRITAISAIVTFSVASASTPSPKEWDYWQLQGNHLLSVGDYSAAMQAFRNALNAAEHSHRSDSVLAIIHSDFAVIFAEVGQFSQSDHELSLIKAIVKKVRGTRSLAYALLCARQAVLPTYSGDKTEVIKILRNAILAEAGTATAKDLAVARDFLAKILCDDDKYDEAQSVLLDGLTSKLSSDSDLLAELLNDLGVIQNHLARYREAANSEEEAVQLLERAYGHENPALVAPLNNLANVYTHIGRLDDADITYQRAVTIAAKSLGADHPKYGAVLINYAVLLRKLGRKKDSKTVEAIGHRIVDESNRHNGVGATISVAALRANQN